MCLSVGSRSFEYSMSMMLSQTSVGIWRTGGTEESAFEPRLNGFPMVAIEDMCSINTAR